MRRRWLVVTMMSGMLLVLSAVEPTPVAGQGAKPYSPRRTADGKPDLQGTYDLATLTPLERPAGMKAVITREEARQDRTRGCRAARGRRSADSRRARSAAQGRRRVGRCRGQRRRLQLLLARSRARPTRSSTARFARRSSSIRRTAGCRAMTPAAAPAHCRAAACRRRFAAEQRSRARNRARRLRRSRTSSARRTVPAGVRLDAGPPALPNYFYNNLHKIVQTPNTILILNEMVHDVRVVRMNAAASAEAYSQVDGRLDRPLGRRHARRGNDQLQRRSDPLCRAGRSRPRSVDGREHRREAAGPRERTEPGSASDRALHARGGQRAALSLHR